MPGLKTLKAEPTIVTPALATQLLEMNRHNRPISDLHVKRLADQITRGLWQYNGDTIKIANNKEVLDGQHRLWAVITADKAIETLIVNGVEPEAFTTIDTLRKHRLPSDIVGMCGTTRNRNAIASALQWFVRYENGVLEDYRAPQHRVENEDVKRAFEKNPGIAGSVEQAVRVRGVVNPGVMGFFHYLLSLKNADLADRMIDIFDDPAGVSTRDPFFKLRAHFLDAKRRARRSDALTSIALMIKAANFAKAGQKIDALYWRNQGRSPEAFPVLK